MMAGHVTLQEASEGLLVPKQRKQARQISVNGNTLWRWERGDRKPHGLHWKLITDLMVETD
jgi:DNA-binding transcriptional regulator YiaG